MPRNIRLGGNTNIVIGTKAELTKLLVTHGVVGADTGDLSKAIEAIEKLPDHVRELDQYVKPGHALSNAATAFKKKYGTKHPKFIQSLTQKYLDPLGEIEEIMANAAKQFIRIEQQFNEAGNFFARASDEMTKGPVNQTSVKAAKDELASAGSLFTNGQNNASLMFNDTGIDVFDKINKAATAVRGNITEIDMVLHKALKDNDFSVSLAPYALKIMKLHGACELFSKMIASVK